MGAGSFESFLEGEMILTMSSKCTYGAGKKGGIVSLRCISPRSAGRVDEPKYTFPEPKYSWPISYWNNQHACPSCTRSPNVDT